MVCRAVALLATYDNHYIWISPRRSGGLAWLLQGAPGVTMRNHYVFSEALGGVLSDFIGYTFALAFLFSNYLISLRFLALAWFMSCLTGQIWVGIDIA
jgi:hypothetical protein